MLKRSALQTVVVRVMKSLPFVVSSLFGLTVYLILELLFGSYGLVAYKVVEGYVAEVEDISRGVALREAELNSEITRLRTDSEAIREAAYDLGLVSNGEGIIRVSGYSVRRNRAYNPGRTVPAMREIADNRPLFRGIGLASALLLLITLLLVQTRERHSR